MAVLNVSLPEPMRQYIEERIVEGNFGNSGEYVRDLIREDQKRRAEQRLEALLLRGMESPATEWTKDDAQHIKDAVRERLAEKQKSA